MTKMEFTAHEETVSRFYSHVIDYNHHYNGGYLTFGIWKTKSGDKIDSSMAYRTMYDEIIADSVLPEHNVLEVACGQAAGMLHIKSMTGCKIQGIDISTGNIELAKRRLQGSGITIQRASAVNMPFDDESFDIIVCVEAAPHFYTREDFFKEAYRVLKPGGKLLVSDIICPEVAYSKANFLQRVLGGLTAWVWAARIENMDYNVDGYKQLLKDNGFTLLEFDLIGDRVIPGYCRFNLVLSTILKLVKIRGLFAGLIGGPIIDVALWIAFYFNLFEYGIWAAEKTKVDQKKLN